MNIHHLELFYYVARHGGIMEAVRNIPYGIQQPAVSSQIAQLEESLGVTLFQRRPFALTPAGKKLFDYVRPFFANLDALENELQGGTTRHVRIGASTVVLRDYLPELFQDVRKKFPGLKMSVREGFPAHLQASLLANEVDLVISLIQKKAVPGIHSLGLLELQPILLVEKNSPLQSAAELWRRDKIDEPLICFPPGEPLGKSFQKKLTELGVDWFPSIEASSADLIATYVASGLGIGVSVAIPQKQFPPKVRGLTLEGFPPVTIGVLWRGRKTPLVQAFLDALQARAARLA